MQAAAREKAYSDPETCIKIQAPNGGEEVLRYFEHENHQPGGSHGSLRTVRSLGKT